MSAAPNPRCYATAAKPPAKSKSQRWPSFFKSLLIPVAVLILFSLGPHWLNEKLRAQIIKSINETSTLSPSEKDARTAVFSRVNFGAIARDNPPEFTQLHDSLVQAGVADTYQYLRWGLDASILLLGLQLLAMGIVIFLNAQARKSQSDLIRNYRLGWRLGMACALIQVILLVLLLTYASYQFPIVWGDHWYPKLVIGILIIGIAALWRCVKILRDEVPLKFNEPMSRRISDQQAPELWAAVRAAAARLQTAPPDNIIIGLQLNFYVTELAVWDGQELANGRTLYLSYPLLKQLPEPEIVAIIGHELGHFIGEDTRLTREFYPLHLKSHGTLVALAGATYVGWTSFHFLNFLNWTFGETKQTVSRQRELLADEKAAALTSPQTIASALVRFHVLLEAFKHGMVDAARKGGQSPLDVPLHTVVREKLPAGIAFWDELFETKLPHPLDSHPALHVRLAALGQTMDAKAAEALSTQETESAYSRWFAHRESIFTDLRRQADEAVEKMRSRVQITDADYQTADGRKLLETHFPGKKWTYGGTTFWGSIFLLVMIAVIGLGCAALLGNDLVPLRIGLGIVGLLGAWGCVVVWARHHGSQFILTADGIKYTGWNRPLRFLDVRQISFTKSNSSITLIFHFKEPQVPIWNFSVFPQTRKTVSFSLSGLTGVKQPIAAQTIFRYFTRQIEQ